MITEKKHSICYVCPEAYPVLKQSKHVIAGGAELQQAILAKEFAKRGHNVSFIGGDYGQPEIEYIDNVKVIKSYKVGYGNRKLRFVSDFYKLFKAMKMANADIYFQRCVFHHTGKVALFAMLNKKKFVFSSGIDFNAHSPRELKGVNPLYKYSYIWGIKKANLVISQNKQQKQNFLSNYQRQSYIIPNIIEDTQPIDIKKQRSSIVILWVGTLSERKQPLVFAELSAHFIDYEFWLIGLPREQRTYDAAQDWAKHNKNFKNIGFVPQHEIHEYFSQADIFVSTALTEGFPNTFLQAMTHSIPIISLNVNPDGVLNKSGCGICCDGNKGLMVSHLRELATDDKKRKNMGKMGLYYVKKYHGPGNIVSMYENLFNRL